MLQAAAADDDDEKSKGISPVSLGV